MSLQIAHEPKVKNVRHFSLRRQVILVLAGAAAIMAIAAGQVVKESAGDEHRRAPLAAVGGNDEGPAALLEALDQTVDDRRREPRLVDGEEESGLGA